MPEDPSERATGDEAGEIATSTLAEIYAQQGLLGRALAIYRRMLSRAPEDDTISKRIESLEQRIVEAGDEAERETTESGGSPEAQPRERLPWDPPEVDEDEPPPTPGAPAPRAVEPMEPGAFEAWLEGR